jgi:hypothetical protein
MSDVIFRLEQDLWAVEGMNPWNYSNGEHPCHKMAVALNARGWVVYEDDPEPTDEIEASVTAQWDSWEGEGGR